VCRHFGYLGDPVGLAELVFAPPHSLASQSYAPHDMRGGGSVNVDGFGVGWYPADPAPADPAPAESRPAQVVDSSEESPPATARRYRRAVPIWQDANFAELAAATRVSGALGALRNATEGMPVAEAACAPFTDGRWLFSLNGRIAGWPDTALRLAAGLPMRQLLTLEAPTDSALLWAVLQHRLSTAQSRGVLDPASVLANLVAQVLVDAPGSRLNTLLTDGRRLYATAASHSLWSRHSTSGVLLASEPFDDGPAWNPIEDASVVTADRGGASSTPLRHTAPEEREIDVYQG
jgi:glutamine amidotransferase